ncbi:hypothetical protein G9394_12380 [Proteus vulgaris]|nr:hypothetical protein G9394_12380 [Proteus vulgaris]
MQNSEKLTFDAPNLPKGGGAVTGLTGNMGAVGLMVQPLLACRCPLAKVVVMPLL